MYIILGFPKIAAFWENPEKNWSNLANIQQFFAKIQQILANFATFCKKSAKSSVSFDEKIEIRERCKGVHCVDLGESFPTSIHLQNLASIQPRTSLVKFARSPRTDPPGVSVQDNRP